MHVNLYHCCVRLLAAFVADAALLFLLHSLAVLTTTLDALLQKEDGDSDSAARFLFVDQTDHRDANARIVYRFQSRSLERAQPVTSTSELADHVVDSDRQFYVTTPKYFYMVLF